MNSKCGYVGSKSEKDGRRLLYIACTKEFFEAFLAQKSYQYSETEERAFKFLETTGENAELLSLRRLTNEALTSGKAVRYAAPPMFKRKKKTKSFRGRKRVRVAHPAHPIYKGTRRWKGVMG